MWKRQFPNLGRAYSLLEGHAAANCCQQAFTQKGMGGCMHRTFIQRACYTHGGAAIQPLSQSTSRKKHGEKVEKGPCPKTAGMLYQQGSSYPAIELEYFSEEVREKDEDN
ncbi:hypothetical protein KC340_g85 [Hortaea werneckii]|nr:hypothetical protein KC340_g85 [Hortaea werneckii]